MHSSFVGPSLGAQLPQHEFPHPRPGLPEPIIRTRRIDRNSHAQVLHHRINFLLEARGFKRFGAGRGGETALVSEDDEAVAGGGESAQFEGDRGVEPFPVCGGGGM